MYPKKYEIPAENLAFSLEFRIEIKKLQSIFV